MLLALLLQKLTHGKVFNHGPHCGDTLVHQVHVQIMAERFAKKLQAQQAAAVGFQAAAIVPECTQVPIAIIKVGFRQFCIAAYQ